MGALRWAIPLGLLLSAAPACAQAIAQWRPFIEEASTRFGIPAIWIERVMEAESQGRAHLGGRPIRSSAGAMGLMQLMPGTWANVRARLGLGENPDDPRDNILAGAFYLRLMHDRFGYPGLFAAYNAGPGRYAEHIAGRRALPVETMGYMMKVAPSLSSPTGIATRATSQASLFAVRKDSGAAASDGAQIKSASSLFIALSQGN